MSLPVKRRVFVGSSTEGVEKANAICKLLTNDQTVALMWTREFEPGYIAIEALENVLDECGAAVFVATPDDKTMLRGNAVMTPRANVMLEFGLLAGRLGRHNIAICLYPNTELPSDLKGLTVIDMEPAPVAGAIDEDQRAAFRQRAEESLKTWSTRVLATAEKVERTTIVHGYTGEWDIEITLEQWRGIVLSPGSYVQGHGTAQLYVDVTGKTGSGLIKGQLTFSVRTGPDPDASAFSGGLRFCHEVTNLVCTSDGGVQLTTRAFALHKGRVSGHPLPELGYLDDQPEPWPFSWNLFPNDSPRTLEGTLEAENPGATRGKVLARKGYTNG